VKVDNNMLNRKINTAEQANKTICTHHTVSGRNGNGGGKHANIPS